MLSRLVGFASFPVLTVMLTNQPDESKVYMKCCVTLLCKLRGG
jgi:hypothetical protein